MYSIAARNGAPAGQTAAGGLGGEAAGFGEAETPCGRQPDPLHGSGKTKKEKPRFAAELFPNQNNFIRRSFYGSEVFVKGGGGDTVVPSFCFYYMLFWGRIPPF